MKALDTIIMSRSQALVTPQLMEWALNRSGQSVESLSKKVGVKPEKMQTWLSGKDRPTFKQAEKYAKVTHTPFGALFLKKVPEEPELLPDLRTIQSRSLAKPSPDLRDVVEHTKYQQEWYKDYLLTNGGERLPFVGSVKLQTPVSETVKSIRETLEFQSKPKETWEDHQKRLIRKIEDAGILVMQSSIVGSNTHRRLSVEEFRGFAIADEYAPVIFVNLADAPTARLFTLIHELAHIWLGSSGISTASATQHSQHQEEAYCNKVAGEFLVPEGELRQKWKDQDEPETNYSVLGKHFHVSPLVIARRAMDLGFISKQVYQNFYEHELKYKYEKKPQKGGGSYYSNLAKSNSYTFSRVITAEAFSGNILFRDAGKLLQIAPANLRGFDQYLRK